MAERFLEGVKVLDLSHMLAGPLAARRLADLGAHVIKIEPVGGESLRARGLPADRVDGDNLKFHSYNAGKEAIALNLKQAEDRALACRLALQADVLVQNFRFGVLARFGLGYEQLKEGNPGLVYASVDGYGGAGPWRDEAGQDLLAQARSGLMFLSGADGPPTPLGGVPVDVMAGDILVQGILAALVRRGRTGQGALVETSLLEACMELQVDSFPMFLAGARRRSRSGNAAFPYMDAPYGVFETSDGYIAIGGFPEQGFQALFGAHLPPPDPQASWDDMRDRRFEAVAAVVRLHSTEYWIGEISALKGWVVEVLDSTRFVQSEGFRSLGIILEHGDERGVTIVQPPLRLDGERPRSLAAPRPDEHAARIRARGWG